MCNTLRKPLIPLGIGASRTDDIGSFRGGERRTVLPELRLPHPGTPERNTVLRPWLDVDPDAVLPGHGPVAALLAGLGDDGLRRRDDLSLGPR